MLSLRFTHCVFNFNYDKISSFLNNLINTITKSNIKNKQKQKVVSKFLVHQSFSSHFYHFSNILLTEKNKYIYFFYFLISFNRICELKKRVISWILLFFVCFFNKNTNYAIINSDFDKTTAKKQERIM